MLAELEDKTLKEGVEHGNAHLRLIIKCLKETVSDMYLCHLFSSFCEFSMFIFYFVYLCMFSSRYQDSIPVGTYNSNCRECCRKSGCRCVGHFYTHRDLIKWQNFIMSSLETRLQMMTFPT